MARLAPFQRGVKAGTFRDFNSNDGASLFKNFHSHAKNGRLAGKLIGAF